MSLKTAKNSYDFVGLLKQYILSATATIIIYYLNLDLTLQGVSGEKNVINAIFGNIVIIPFYIVIFILASCLSISTLFRSIKCIGSEDTPKKVMSIFILILTIAMIVILVLLALQVFGLI